MAERRKVTLGARAKEIFRSAFFELSGFKKRLLQTGLVLLGLGGVGAGYVLSTGQGAGESSLGGWSWAALSSGAGCVLGFILGAALRVFLKLALLLGVVVAGVLFGISWMGWVDLPFSSFGEINSAVGDAISRGFASMQDLLSGYLPSSVFSGLGLASGITQKPDTDPDD